MTAINEVVTLTFSRNGRPERLHWRHRAFVVNDTPTALGTVPDLPIDPVITHVPRPAPSWRFQAASADGETHVFDVRADERAGRWLLLRTYD